MRLATMQRKTRIATYAATALFLFSSCKDKIDRIEKTERTERADIVMPNGDGRQAFASVQKTDAKTPLPVARKIEESEHLIALRQKIDSVKDWSGFLREFDNIAKLIGLAAVECKGDACAKSIADAILSLDKKLEMFDRGWRGVIRSTLFGMHGAIEDSDKLRLMGFMVFLRFSNTAQADWTGIKIGENATGLLFPSDKKRGIANSNEFNELIGILTDSSLEPKVKKTLLYLLDNGEIKPHSEADKLKLFIEFSASLSK